LPLLFPFAEYEMTTKSQHKKGEKKRSSSKEEKSICIRSPNDITAEHFLKYYHIDAEICQPRTFF
jgi:hypothetical protein